MPSFRRNVSSSRMKEARQVAFRDRQRPTAGTGPNRPITLNFPRLTFPSALNRMAGVELQSQHNASGRAVRQWSLLRSVQLETR